MSCFKFGHLNVRSLMNGFDDFKNYLVMGDFDIFAVSETWLCPNIASDAVRVPNYHFLRRDRGSRGGGLGFYVKEHISVKVITTPVSSAFEQLWFSAKIKGKHYTFSA